MSVFVMSPRVVAGVAPRGGAAGARGRVRRPVRPRRFLAWALAACGVGMLPWIVVIGVTLPGTTVVTHWSAAWVGLDVAEAVGLASTGWLLRAGDPRHGLTAAATAMVLVVDAWFDVTTSGGGSDLLIAVCMAVCAELPLAAVCALVALRSFQQSAPQAEQERPKRAPGGVPARRASAAASPTAPGGRATRDSARSARPVANLMPRQIKLTDSQLVA